MGHLVHMRSSQGSGIITEEGAERFEEPFVVCNTGKACLLEQEGCCTYGFIAAVDSMHDLGKLQ